METILVVEDDWALNDSIAYALAGEGYDTVCAHSIEEAKQVCQKREICLALLDVNLPDGDGFSLCRWIKEHKRAPVLFLTARDLEEDALRGYELGAQDYVTKPFSVRILLKKIDVILKRVGQEEPEIVDDGFLKVDFTSAKVWVDGEECLVTPTEFRLLHFFLMNQGRLLTYDVLLDKLWDSKGQYVDKHTLAVNINRLRGKIETGQHQYISNVYGMGYQWVGLSD